MRIVSTLPSATEILCALGLESELVGVSDHCDHPPSVLGKPKVVRSVADAHTMRAAEIDALVSEHSRTGRPLHVVDGELLLRLKPDLIVTQDLCSVCAVPSSEVLGVLQGVGTEVATVVPEVVNLRPHGLEDVFQNILRIGEVTNRAEAAIRLVGELRARVERVKALPRRGVGVVCLEWLDPPHCAGQWMPELVEYAGGRELLGSKGEHSHRISWEEVVDARPEYIFIAACGHDIARTIWELEHLLRKKDWGGLRALREAEVYVMNGKYYSRPGPRLVDALEALAAALHPGLLELPKEIGLRLEEALSAKAVVREHPKPKRAST